MLGALARSGPLHRRSLAADATRRRRTAGHLLAAMRLAIALCGAEVGLDAKRSARPLPGRASRLV